jgi:hypothetical protein
MLFALYNHTSPGKEKSADHDSTTTKCDRVCRQGRDSSIGYSGTDYCYCSLEPGQPDLIRMHSTCQLQQRRIVATYKKAVKLNTRHLSGGAYAGNLPGRTVALVRNTCCFPKTNPAKRGCCRFIGFATPACPLRVQAGFAVSGNDASIITSCRPYHPCRPCRRPCHRLQACLPGAQRPCRL